ncbi:MAG: hypothetical protein K0Q55_3479 [Verrucomicrobia bacterium]|jgi:hypothetical protein|nr:hypothetical protein [Verrucomicrobiota bacterium]
MKSASQPEMSSYASVLERVRRLRSTGPVPTAPQPTNYPKYLRSRIRQARIRLRLPVYSEAELEPKKEATTAERVISLLGYCFPFLIASALICSMAYNLETTRVISPAPTPGVRSFSYTAPQTLAASELTAIEAASHAWESLRQAGYDITEWQMWTTPQMTAPSVSPSANPPTLSAFHRIDATTGYFRFQHSHFPQHLVTVTLRQKGGIVHVLVSDPKTVK